MPSSIIPKAMWDELLIVSYLFFESLSSPSSCSSPPVSLDRTTPAQLLNTAEPPSILSSLPFNDLSGEIPSGIWDMEKLKLIDLEGGSTLRLRFTAFVDLPPIHKLFSNKQRTRTCHIPDNFTLPCVIKACVGALNLICGQVVNGMGVKTDLISNVFVGNALVAMYEKFELIEDAVKVFDFMPKRNLINLLKLAHFAVIVSRQYSIKEVDISYLEGVIEKL
ncbi:unnamed protein product [Lactuca virosa]|uniref:Pentatricopeptide repeat-containing protein n=1 Tax=Lactuca virosa TaxID=75947 RepID=A0AAU9N072_9ASTR|nr:unnamed protein product [Lactuca virosa]